MFNDDEQNRENVSDQGGESGRRRVGRDPDDYTDASYTRTEDARPILTPNYRYSAPRRERKPRNRGGLRIVALCIACAIFGGIGGSLTTSYILRGSDALREGTEILEPRVEPSALPTQYPVSRVSVNADRLPAEDIYDMACPQIVGITSEITTVNFFGQMTVNPVSGSGFVVSADGYIVTNYHVIEEAHKRDLTISVMLHSGEKHNAEIVGVEPENDLAVLRIEAEELSPVTLGNSDEMRVGETLYAIGNPLGELTYTMTTGTLSALDRSITTEDSTLGKLNVFQFDAAVNPGNSGGPVYNAYGEVVGIVTAKSSTVGVEGIGFAIPINDAIRIMNQLIENGYVSGKASIGIQPLSIGASTAQYYNLVEGVYVYTVIPDGAADEAGIRQGDIITELNGTATLTEGDLRAVLRRYAAGDTAMVTLFRGGEYIELEVTFTEKLPDTLEVPVTATPQRRSPFTYW